MVCFQTKNPNLGKFWRVFATEDDCIFNGHSVHFTIFCYILWTFGIVRGNWVTFSRFGILYQENLATLKQCLRTSEASKVCKTIHFSFFLDKQKKVFWLLINMFLFLFFCRTILEQSAKIDS
jgi:hypothetical protein